MTLMDLSSVYRRLGAPREDGAVLIDPPLSAVGELIERNVELTVAYDCDIQGRPLAELARQARQELLRESWQYTRAYRDVPQPNFDALAPILIAGHQPQLFHPGVWFKNFTLSALGRQHGAAAVNLVIDSDTLKSATLRVPGGSIEHPRVENVPYDRATAEMPYEERAIVDRDCLESFGSRAGNIIRPLVPDPLLDQFWPLVSARAAECNNLGSCLAQARHQQEGRWGAVTYELPQSRVCSLESFYWFTCHLLAQLPRLWEAYNAAIADYRRLNHLRSRTHPVPDLASDGQWLEAPFWIWKSGAPTRRRLFVRQDGDDLVLSDRSAIEHAIPLAPEADASRGVERLADLTKQGVKLRTRALVTTMFARLVLGDVFLHGIGGAKYDQATDLLIRRFFGLEPPGYMTLTATLRLPIEHHRVTIDDQRQIDQRLRELDFHPERYLEPSGDGAAELVSTKRQWIETKPTKQNARTRCREIRRVNQALQGAVEPQRRKLLTERARVATALAGEAILSSREYAFCLYPEWALRTLLKVLPA